MNALTWQAANQEKKRAHQHVGRALRSGELVRPSACEWCGTVGIVVAHHKDYSQPLMVDWLCNVCHGNYHVIDKDSAKHQARLHLHSENPRIHCANHPSQILVCRRCEQVKAGKATARKHPGMAKEWGRRGGRPRKAQ